MRVIFSQIFTNYLYFCELFAQAFYPFLSISILFDVLNQGPLKNPHQPTFQNLYPISTVSVEEEHTLLIFMLYAFYNLLTINFSPLCWP